MIQDFFFWMSTRFIQYHFFFLYHAALPTLSNQIHIFAILFLHFLFCFINPPAFFSTKVTLMTYPLKFWLSKNIFTLPSCRTTGLLGLYLRVSNYFLSELQSCYSILFWLSLFLFENSTLSCSISNQKIMFSLGWLLLI